MQQLAQNDDNEFSSLTNAIMKAYDGDPYAFEILYESYKKPLGKRLMNLTGNEEVAFEIYQETLFRMWIWLSKRRHISAPTLGYFERTLYCIARNLAFDHLRHIKNFEFVSLPESEPNGPKEYALAGRLSQAGHEERVCEMLYLRQALACMSPQYRTCLLLQVEWGYSQREIAESLAISETTVSSNVSRGYKQLHTICLEMKKGEQE